MHVSPRRLVQRTRTSSLQNEGLEPKNLSELGHDPKSGFMGGTKFDGEASDR